MKFATLAIFALLTSAGVTANDSAVVANEPNQLRGRELQRQTAEKGPPPIDDNDVTETKRIGTSGGSCANKKDIDLYVKLDDKPWQTSWEMYDQNGWIIDDDDYDWSDSQKFYKYTYEACPGECVTTTIFDSAGDGFKWFGYAALKVDGNLKKFVWLVPFEEKRFGTVCVPNQGGDPDEDDPDEDVTDAYKIYAVNNCGREVEAKFKLRDATPGYAINGQKYTNIKKVVPQGGTVYIGKCDRAKQTVKKTKPAYLAEEYKKKVCVGGKSHCEVKLC